MSKDTATKSEPKEGKKQAPKEEKRTIVDEAREYVRERFATDLDPKFLFHNYAYSEELADQAEELGPKAFAGQEGGAAGAGEKEISDLTEKLTLAAWFYPLGYTGGAEGWAERSAAALERFAAERSYSLDTSYGKASDWIRGAEGATKQDNFAVRLLHDISYDWFGRKRYDRRSDLLQLEEEALEPKGNDPISFFDRMQGRLLNFNYLTVIGNKEYDKRRRKNVSSQQSDFYKLQQKETKAKTGKNFGRGIDTMYRTAFRNHINLSRIADGKANMMISINSIILTVTLALSGASLSYFEDLFFENPEFLVPIIILLVSSLLAVVFSVFSARPKVTEYRIKKRKLLNSDEASLLYFGNFLKVEKDDFVQHLAKMKMDQNSLYDDLARDLYDLGQVLHRKYLLLTISYNTFVGGLSLAVISFMIVYLLNVL